MAKLEVQITGNVQNLEKALNKAEKDLQDLDKQSIKTGSRVQRSASQAATGINKLGGATANAVPAVTEFSRVIQDAPFGIQGVANNITQLTQQFGTLSTKLGGSRAALKAMLSTLSGPAGILLAISAVTSLLVAFGGSLFGASKNSDKLGDSTKKTNEELESQGAILKGLIKEYETFNKIRTQSIFNTTKEKESVKALFSVLRDELSTTEERQRAYSALNKTYSDYLKNVDPKNINQVIKAEEKLSKQLEIREKRIQTLNKLEEVARDIQLKRIEIENLGNVPLNDKRLIGLGNEILKLRELQKELRTALNLYTALDTSIGSSGTREFVTPLNLSRIGINASGGGASASGSQDAEAPILQNALDQISDFEVKIKAALLRLNEGINQIIQNNLVNTFAGIGQAIGGALSGAGQIGDNLAKVLLSSVGALLTQLGKLAIAIGVGLIKIRKALETVNGPLAIGAGVALVALGSIFKSGSARIGQQAGGGGSTGGVAGATSGGFGGGRTSFSGSQITGNVTFRIAGTDLIGVLNNQLDQNGIFGGNIIVNG